MLDPFGAITGTVTDLYDGTPVAGATIVATEVAGVSAASLHPTPLASSFSTTTDTNGDFVLAVPPGDWIVTVQFPGYNDTTTDPISVAPAITTSMGTIELRPEGPEPTLVTYTGDVSGRYNETLTLAATLTTQVDGAALPGRTVSFQIDGDTHNATTGADGIASVTITAEMLPGDVDVTARFAGETDYRPSDTTATITIDRAAASILYTGRSTLVHGFSEVVRALLVDEAGPLP